MSKILEWLCGSAIQRETEKRVAARTAELEGIEARRLSDEFETTLQRYDTALRRSNVTIFTQDNDLRYTSISKPLLGLAVDEIIGRSDEEILPATSRSTIVALKRAVLATGTPSDSEISIKTDEMDTRWYDLHIEPLQDVDGVVIGLTCVAVDVTERKEDEAHLRLLLRELTHRSKNLLAVIQAMARQTARYSGSVDSFLERFNARLQALATSHDVLVQEGWHGASLGDLVRLQLGQYLDRADPQIAIAGPTALLKPEAAQSLGLALHELCTNAAKYGALSAPTGRVSVTWRRLPEAGGDRVEFEWVESGGPVVNAPDYNGFGRLVIERNLSRVLEAKVDLAFPPEGVRCIVVLPPEQLVGNR